MLVLFLQLKFQAPKLITDFNLSDYHSAFGYCIHTFSKMGYPLTIWVSVH